MGAPDVALRLLNLGAVIHYPLVDGLNISETHQLDHQTSPSQHQRGMDDLYFNSSWWIAGHNLLHAPLILLVLIAVASVMKPPWTRRVRFFAAGALLHSMIDVVVHHDDGPLPFFPVSSSIGFSSPVDYWDPDHYGWFARPIDLAITAVGAIWLAWWWRTRRSEQSKATGSK